MKRALLALAVGATVGISAHASPLLSEGFNNVAGLAGAGWTLTNSSTPVGNSWFQGNPGVFTAQAGADNSYIAANWLTASGGSGTLNNLLATPYLAMTDAVVLTFYARAADEGFEDHFSVSYEAQGGGTTMLSADTLAVGEWTKYTYIVSGKGGTNGRFDIRYIGSADNADYIGFDSLVVDVPEPSELALFGAALGALALIRRKAGQKA